MLTSPGSGFFKQSKGPCLNEISLISTIATGLAFALVGGLAASRMRLPPLVGYLVAGIAVGPYTPGFVGDTKVAAELAEIGVMLMMFSVGMHFSLNDLFAVRRIALLGAIAQIIIATALGVGTALLWGWSMPAGLVLGLSLSVASTVVLLRELQERQMFGSARARIAVGWVIVEDLVTVLVLVLLPALAVSLGGNSLANSGLTEDGNMLQMLLATLGNVVTFVVLMLAAGARLLPWLLECVVRTRSRELFTLAVVTIALGVAFASAEVFGVSFALGAFFAGLVVNQSDHSGRAAAELLPIQDAFAVLFFVSVGMLFDPSILVTQAPKVLSVTAIILLGKSLAAYLLVVALRYPSATALTVSASLAQIGEFSFILGEMGVVLGLLPREGQSLIIAGALISITLNPLVFRAAGALERRFARHSS
jgi:CPA2 family monovalent cation:H+ antiporter-2